jgi:hypothetical protein
MKSTTLGSLGADGGLFRLSFKPTTTPLAEIEASTTSSQEAPRAVSSSSSNAAAEEEERALIAEMAKRDREVMAHMQEEALLREKQQQEQSSSSSSSAANVSGYSINPTQPSLLTGSGSSLFVSIAPDVPIQQEPQSFPVAMEVEPPTRGADKGKGPAEASPASSPIPNSFSSSAPVNTTSPPGTVTSESRGSQTEAEDISTVPVSPSLSSSSSSVPPIENRKLRIFKPTEANLNLTEGTSFFPQLFNPNN